MMHIFPLQQTRIPNLTEPKQALRYLSRETFKALTESCDFCAARQSVPEPQGPADGPPPSWHPAYAPLPATRTESASSPESARPSPHGTAHPESAAELY